MGNEFEKFFPEEVDSNNSNCLAQFYANYKNEDKAFITTRNVIKTNIRVLEENLDILPESKILDPACGSGAFLSQAYDLLYLKYGEYNELVTVKTIRESEKLGLMKYLEDIEKFKTEFNKKILTNNLFGVDINPESVEITKMSLWFKTAQKEIPLNKLEGILNVEIL